MVEVLGSIPTGAKMFLLDVLLFHSEASDASIAILPIVYIFVKKLERYFLLIFQSNFDEETFE